ncbi:hypothetical protein BGZ52_009668, partial [Haplosporangium bisporale]
LLEQLRSKLNIHSIQSEPNPESNLSPEPESVLNPESSVLNHTSDGAEPMMSVPLLFLPVKMKSTKVHFMFKKAMKNDQAFLGIVCPKEPKDKPLPLDPKVQNLLTEYANVFPNKLLKDLPPEQAVDHCINLLPDSALVSKLMYKMSLAEMDKLH